MTFINQFIIYYLIIYVCNNSEFPGHVPFINQYFIYTLSICLSNSSDFRAFASFINQFMINSVSLMRTEANKYDNYAAIKLFFYYNVLILNLLYFAWVLFRVWILNAFCLKSVDQFWIKYNLLAFCWCQNFIRDIFELYLWYWIRYISASKVVFRSITGIRMKYFSHWFRISRWY